MGKTKRLLALVSLLAGRRSRSVSELARHFETSERTIFRDLRDLEELHIPLTRDERGYRLMPDAHLAPLALDAAERAVLRLVLTNPALRRTQGLARRLEQLAAKLEAVTPAQQGAAAVVLASIDRSGPIQPGVVEALERAIERSTSVEIDYASLRSGRRSRRGVDPWVVFHRAEAWYLAGRCHRSGEARIFRIDRIASVRDRGVPFTRPDGFDLEQLLRGAWSLHHGEPRHEVAILFDASLAPLIANARHHEGESVARLPDGSLDYRVVLADLEEIARWIVGFGGKAVAQQPAELVERVREIAAGVADAHPTRKPLRAAAKSARRRPAAPRTAVNQ